MSPADYFVTYLLGTIASLFVVSLLDATRREEDQMAEGATMAAIVFWPVGVPVVIARTVSYHIGPRFGQEARLCREIRRVEKDRRLLALRADLDRERAAYAAEYDRYVTDDPETVESAIARQLRRRPR